MADMRGPYMSQKVIGRKAIVLRASDSELVGIVVSIYDTTRDGWCYVNGVPRKGVWIIPRECLLIIRCHEE